MNPLDSKNLDWPGVIGLFIVNFGVLDLLVLEFLKERLPPASFAKFQRRDFQQRIELIKQQVAQVNCSAEERARFEDFLHRLDPIRKLRNQVAHGLLLTRPVEGTKSFFVTLSLPRDLDADEASDTRNLEFDDLVDSLNELSGMIEEFKQLAAAAVKSPNS